MTDGADSGATRDSDPAMVELGPAWVDGRPSRRLMVILRAPGCDYARRTGGCTNCGFFLTTLTTDGEAVPADALVAQLRRALDRHADALPSVEQLDLYNSGSFFCDAEIPPAAQRRLLAEIGAIPSLRRVLVESRPDHVTAERLSAATSALRAAGARAELEIAIGLESADEVIREQRIRKGFTLAAFERAAAAIAEAGCSLAVYVLLKPLGTTEAEALDDVLNTGDYLAQLRGRLDMAARVALEPCFVPEDTPLHAEMTAGRYRPPSLWTVVAAVRGLVQRDLQVHVGLSDEGLPIGMRPAGCERCTRPLNEALARFNQTQDLAQLDSVTCEGGRAGHVRAGSRG